MSFFGSMFIGCNRGGHLRSIVRKWKWSYRELIPFLLAGVLTCVGLLLLLPDETESEVHIQQNADASYLQVYLMDEDHLLVPLFFSQEADNDPQRQIEVMVGYLSGKQPLEGFQSFFTQEDVLDSVEVSDGRATLCFNERFLSYDAQDELRLVEALVWGTTQFSGVEEVVFQLDGETLTSMPQAGTPLAQPLSRKIGINHFESSSATLHDSTSLLVYGVKKIDGMNYLVPRSRRVDAASRSSLEAQTAAILRDLSASSTLTSTMDDHALSIDIQETGIIDLTLDESIFSSDQSLRQDDVNELVLSLCALPEVQGIRLICDGTACDADQVLKADQLYYNIVELH